MSAFIVDIETYEYLAGFVDSMNRNYNNEFNNVYWPLRHAYNEVIREFGEFTSRDVKALMYLNILAVNGRYKDSNASIKDHLAIFRPKKSVNIFEIGKLEDTAAITSFIKALDCIIYQCGEGAVLDNEKRKATLDRAKRFKSIAAGAIFTNSKQYELAAWGEIKS